MNKIENWEGFVSLAYSHGIFPLVYRTLKEYAHLIPEYIFAHMKQNYMDIVKQNMLMTSELIKVIKILEENGIEAISFKGPVLSQMAYGDVVSRQYCDLDILVKEKDLNKSFVLLENNYFKSSLNKDFIFNKLFLEKNSDISFINDKNNLSIELHWKLFRNKFSSDINNKDFFNSKNKLEINNQELYIFNYELLLVYLCMHGSKHKWERIEWIADIDKLLRTSEDINWKLVVEISKKYNCNKMLNLGLLLSYELYDTPIQIDSIKKIEEKYYKETIKYILTEMSNITVFKSEFEKNYTSFKFHLNLNENLYDKVYFLKKTFFELSTTDVNFLYLSENFFLVHYFIKPFRLSIKYIKKIIR
jgi:hypothetical protein